MSPRWHALALPLALCAASTASAQDKPGGDVVVTGHRPLDKHETVRLVAKMSAPVQEQLVKFIEPVCPLVIGFIPPVEKMIETRLRQVAVGIGAQVAKAPCRGNVIVIANREPGKLVAALRNREPGLFANVEPSAINKLVSSDAPVRSWTATATVNEDGQRMGAPLSGDPADPPTLIVKTASIMNPSSQQIIDASVLVVDTGALIGKTALQVADYVAMRTFARTRSMTGGANTILTLFDPDEKSPPPGLTQIDADYLRALYAMPGNRTGTYQIGRIAQLVSKGAAKTAENSR